MLKQKAFNALALLWLGTLLGAGLAFLIQIILARKLGSEYFGMFSAVLAMVTLVTPLAGFGISQLWLKVFGQERWNAQKWIKPSFDFVILSTSILLHNLSTAWNGDEHSNLSNVPYMLSKRRIKRNCDYQCLFPWAYRVLGWRNRRTVRFWYPLYHHSRACGNP